MIAPLTPPLLSYSLHPARWDQRVRQKHNAAFINPPFLSTHTHTHTEIITTKQKAEGHFLPYEFSFLGTFIFILSHSVSPFLAMSQECGKIPVCVCVSARLMRTLHRGPVSHSGVCPRMSRAGAHNSGAVGGGWRKLRAAACDAKRWRHSGEGRLEWW